MSDLITVVNMTPNNISGESNQDSEPNLAVNPANPLEMAATAFTPSTNVGSKNSPIYYSNDGGNTWSLVDLIPGTPVRDQTVRFGTSTGELYGGVLWGTGNNISAINFDVLRTNSFTGLTTMTVLATRTGVDQPYIQAATVPAGPDAGKDRIYVGSNDHGPANTPATVDLSLDALAAAPTVTTDRLEDRVVSRDGYQTRLAIHPNGTIYAAYYGWVTGSGSNSEVVVVRDDAWASGVKPFSALIDTDGKRGIRVVQGVNNPGLTINIGQQRIGGDLSIAVDPRDSAVVYLCWGDLPAGTYTLHVRKSIDSGATWGADIRTVLNATNPALAVNDEGLLGFVYQQVTGVVPNERWLTSIELTRSDFANFRTHYLCNSPADTPRSFGDPYLGDYLSMMTVGDTFFGIFCANNTPDKANFPNDVTYQRNANFTTKTLLANDDVTLVPVSIDPFFFKVVVRYGRVVTSIANSGFFGTVCVESFVDELLTINNSGTGRLHITSIVATPPVDFLVPSVLKYPIKLEAGDSIDVMLRFEPRSPGPKFATITIFSDDPAGPHTLKVSGHVGVPRLSVAIADNSNFGRVCVGSFADESLRLMNTGTCRLTVSSITATVPFLVPNVVHYPIVIGAGDAVAVPIRFEPTGTGPQSGTVTITSNDPANPTVKIDVRGDAPTGRIAVTGSLCFGPVPACCPQERTLTICNTGDCKLHVKRVAFKRKSRHWALVNNPFPAALHAGSCMNVVVRYRADEKCPRPCEIVIESDDPVVPIKTLEAHAVTDWDTCRCGERCGECGKGDCDKRRRDCERRCCDDDDCCGDDADSDHREHGGHEDED